MTWVRTLEFTTVASCAVDCSYCPQAVLAGAYRGDATLSLARFARVADALPANVVIHFSGFVEPWLNSECTAMLLYALGLGRRVAVYTTLIGMRTPRLVADVLTRYRDMVDHVCVHLPDLDGNMPLKPKAEALDAFSRIPGVEMMSMGQPAVRLGPMSEWAPVDRAGSLVGKGLPLVRHVGPIRCSYTPTYEHNVMLPNGDVVLCCMDYALRHPIGNLFTQKWDELDRGTVAKDNEGERGSAICRRCSGAEAAS